MTKSILATGGIYIDINCHGVAFEGSMPAEVEIDGADYEVLAGGSGVNFGRLCAQLGLSPAFIGKVGDDPMGEFAKLLLEDAGIRPMLVTDGSVSTQIGMNFINDKGETVMPGAGNANKALGPDEVLSQLRQHAEEIDYLYLGTCLKLPRLIPAYPEMVDIAHRNGAKVIVDHGRVSATVNTADLPAIRSLIESVDYYIPSTDEFQQVWEVGSIEEGLRKVSSVSPAITVVKDGPNGAFALENDHVINAKAFNVDARHLVGAGDSFNAGFMAAQAADLKLADSMRYACAVAALKISGQPVNTESVNRLTSA